MVQEGFDRNFSDLLLINFMEHFYEVIIEVLVVVYVRVIVDVSEVSSLLRVVDHFIVGKDFVSINGMNDLVVVLISI